VPAAGILLVLAAATFADASSSLVHFATADGGVVYADVYGAGEDAVVLAHGARFTKESWATQAPAIAKSGFRVLAIDFRGRGQSRGGSSPDAADALYLDVLAAVRYLREHGATTVSVVGASLGGWATARAAVAAPPGEIDAVILLAAPPIDEPEEIQGRKLFITAREDTDGHGRRRLDTIRQQYKRASKPKELVVLDGSAHAQFIFETKEGTRLMDEILRFLTAPRNAGQKQ